MLLPFAFGAKSDRAYKFKYAKNDTGNAVNIKKESENPSYDINDRNCSKHADENARYCANNDENNKLNNEGGEVAFFNFKGRGPIFSENIHYKSSLL